MITTTNTPLNVPFKEKDEAKSHGARWNPDGKHWYIPEGLDTTPFEKWLTDAPLQTSTHQQKNMPLGAQSPIANPVKPTENTPSKAADIDNINAMLRDAYEVNDG